MVVGTPKVFVTGSTGYIGGDALDEILTARPNYDYTCLVRDSDKGAQVASKYPKIRLVYGTLDDADLLETEAKSADIVLDCANADHEGSARSIAAGLGQHPPDSPGYWIHTSGTGILLYQDLDSSTFGEPSSKVYDDWDGVAEVTSLPMHAPHRNVDKIVLDAATEHSDTIKSAIVCPPIIYGFGRGPGNKRSHQVPELARCTLQRGEAFHVRAGKAYWNCIHVHDLSKIYLRLLEEAVKTGGTATWGPEGYYFAENGEIVWGDVSRQVAVAAHKQGFIETEKVVSISAEEANKQSPMGAALWGANSRSKAIRARQLLGWSPKERSLKDHISEAVAYEAKRTGLVQGHAKEAAGEA
ncbi:MAG: hypothetical protein M1817_000940 [Caeruleum heppii]|nr:MAG: hypothetical protein M1817_000940 [Caeruleum heppii]